MLPFSSQRYAKKSSDGFGQGSHSRLLFEDVGKVRPAEWAVEIIKPTTFIFPFGLRVHIDLRLSDT